MKLSKSLLAAITAGILFTSTTSCDNVANAHLPSCEENCSTDHGEEAPFYPCPACGMG